MLRCFSHLGTIMNVTNKTRSVDEVIEQTEDLVCKTIDLIIECAPRLRETFEKKRLIYSKYGITMLIEDMKFKI